MEKIENTVKNIEKDLEIKLNIENKNEIKENVSNEFSLPEKELDDTYLKVIELLESNKFEIIKLEVRPYYSNLA